MRKLQALLCFPVLLLMLPLVACTDDGNDATGPSALTSLLGIEWSLVQLEGRPAGPGGGRHGPTLLLSSRDARASGFAGCNQFTGRYELSGDGLRFGPLAMTRMACAEGMDLEQRYAMALAATRTYRIKGSQLELLAADRVLAVFQQP